MAAVLAAGQDYRRTGDVLMMAFGIGLRERFELVDDRLHVGVFVAFGEEVRKEMRHRCGAKRRAQILERVGPAIVDTVGRVVGDSSLSEFLVGVVTSAGQHERRGFVGALVVHVGSERRAHRTADQDRFFARQRVVNCLPTGLGHVGHGEPGVGFRRAAVPGDIDGDTPVPGR